MTIRDYSYVAAQGAALAGLAWPGRPLWPLPKPAKAVGAAAMAAGIGMQVAGVLTLGQDVAATPRPRQAAELHSHGPYRYVRHPIYAGLLLMGTGAAVLRRRPEPVVALAALAGVLHLKAGYEESLLRARYGAAYERYAQQVPRLVPSLRARRRRRTGSS